MNQHDSTVAALVQRATSTGRAYALLFKEDGTLAIRTATGKQFAHDQSCPERMDRLVGVYDDSALPHQIASDIEETLGAIA